MSKVTMGPNWAGATGTAKGCAGAMVNKVAVCNGESEVRVHSPGCLGRPENGGRHDEHGQYRPGPGLAHGVGRWFDGLPYAHSRQVNACQCIVCNKWEEVLQSRMCVPAGVVPPPPDGIV
jgi:hypothetical protein